MAAQTFLLKHKGSLKMFLHNSMLDGFPDGVVIYNREGKVQYINSFFTDIFGFTAEELLGKSIPFVPDSEIEITQQAIEQVLSGKPVSNLSTKRLKSNGKTIAVNLSGSLYYDQSGTPSGILVIFRDISDRKELEDKLKAYADELERRVEKRTREIEKERTQFQALVDGSPFGISIINSNGRTEYTNQMFRGIFGYRLEEMGTYVDWFKTNLKDFSKGMEAEKIWQNLLTGTKDSYTLHFACKNGDIKIISIKSVTLPNQNLFITYQDITDRESVERELRIKTHYLEKLAAMDGLTNLYNKRTFMEILKKEVVRAQRYHENLSLLMVDIDCFKDVNDSHGHLFGDQVLKEVSQTMKSLMRTSDVLARYGGEEFIGVLINTGLQDAEMMGERLRQSVSQKIISNGRKSMNVTVSVGVASMLLGVNDTPEQIISRADEALYRAKAKGRNRVCLSLISPETDQKSGVLNQKGPSADVIKDSLRPLLDIFKNDSMEVIFRLTELFRGEAQYFKEHALEMGAFFDQLQRVFPLPGNVLAALKRAAHLHELSRHLADREMLLKNTPRSDYDKEFRSLHIDLLDEIIDSFQIFSDEKSILRYHHENFDGQGYPLGLTEDEIPIISKIYHVVDAITSMKSNRPYRKSYTNAEIIDELDKHSGTQFDPSIVNIAKQVLETETKNI